MARTERSGHTTTDHDFIRAWVEERGGWPARVAGTEGAGDDAGLIRIDFPGYSGEGSLERIEWEDWFEKFDESDLAFLHRDMSHGGGDLDRFNKLVKRSSADNDNESSSRGRSSRSGGGSGSKSASSSSGSGNRSRSGSSSGGSSRSGSSRSGGTSSTSRSGGSKRAAASDSSSGGSSRSSSSKSSSSGSRSGGTSSSSRGGSSSSKSSNGSSSTSSRSSSSRSGGSSSGGSSTSRSSSSRSTGSKSSSSNGSSRSSSSRSSGERGNGRSGGASGNGSGGGGRSLVSKVRETLLGGGGDEPGSEMRELLKHELGDLLFAEKVFLKATRTLAKEAQDPTIKTRVEEHIRETEGQIERLNEAFRSIGEKPKAEKCEAALGLQEEHDSFKSEEKPSKMLLSAFDLGSGLRVEHYEIAAYRTAIAVATAVGARDCANILKENLKEEMAMASFLEKNAPAVLKAMARA